MRVATIGCGKFKLKLIVFFRKNGIVFIVGTVSEICGFTGRRRKT